MEFWNSLNGAELFFLTCATIGGTVFMVQLVLLFTGVIGDVDGDADGDFDADHDVDGDVAPHGGADFSFKLLSLQGVTGFLMMFGLIGLSMLKQFHTGLIASMIGGVASGLITVYLISWLFTLFRRMQHSGTMNLNNAVGQEGTIYLGIPADGEVGKIQVAIQSRLTVMDAVSEDKSEIKTDTRVRVVGITSGNILVVKAL